MRDGGRGKEVVHGDGEEPLDLAGVEVHGDHVVRTRAGEQLSYQPVEGAFNSFVDLCVFAQF